MVVVSMVGTQVDAATRGVIIKTASTWGNSALTLELPGVKTPVTLDISDPPWILMQFSQSCMEYNDESFIV